MPVASLPLLMKAAAALVIASGFIVALAAWPPTADTASFLLDLLFWPLDGAPRLDSPAARLLAAIGGGVMVGWGVMLWLLAAHLLPQDPATAARIVRASILAWFAVDSLGSLAAGAPLNAALNVVFAAAFLWPLSRVRS